MGYAKVSFRAEKADAIQVSVSNRHTLLSAYGKRSQGLRYRGDAIQCKVDLRSYSLEANRSSISACSFLDLVEHLYRTGSLG